MTADHATQLPPARVVTSRATATALLWPPPGAYSNSKSRLQPRARSFLSAGSGDTPAFTDGRLHVMGGLLAHVEALCTSGQSWIAEKTI